MRKTNTQKLGDAIKEMLRLNGIDEKIDEHKLVRSWKNSRSYDIQAHYRDLYFR